MSLQEVEARDQLEPRQRTLLKNGAAELPVVDPFSLEGLLERIRTRQYRIGIVGLGYVGLPLARAANEQGFEVLGFDVDAAKVATVNAGKSPLKHIPDADIAKHRESGLFEATDSFARIGEADCLLICVPTPVTRHRDPDLSYVTATARSIAPHLRRGQLIVLESTTFPGTTTEVFGPVIEAAKLTLGKDVWVAYSPEREDPGNLNFGTSQIPKVVGADDEGSVRLACALYDQFVCQTVPVSSSKAAEAVKITENIFRSVNIALVNELKDVYERMGIDVWEVIDAAATKPFGFMPFYPGPGIGGHCIPVDPFYLTWKAREFGASARLVEMAADANMHLPAQTVQRFTQALDRVTGKGLKGSNILVVGVAYKKNVDDMRESPALEIVEDMVRRGARVTYHDPWIPELRHAGLELTSQAITPEMLADIDAAIVVTDHDDVDYEMLVERLPLVVDTRNAIKDLAQKGVVVKA